MKEIKPEEINAFFKVLKRKLSIELDENDLAGEVTRLSSEIASLRQEKEYLENAQKLLLIIKNNYQYSLDKSTFYSIPPMLREIEESLRGKMKQIIYKTERLESYQLLLDFTTFDNFSQIVDIRTRKRTLNKN